jgi:Kef-type K+ transport system membrane component KefB
MFEALQEFFEGASMMMRFVFSFSILLLAPRLFQKLRLPGVLGLIAAGVAFGPQGLHLFKENGQVLMAFAFLGKLLLLFFSGLDIEMDVLKRNLKKSLTLALFSFLIPAIGGFVLGLVFNFGWMSSFLIAILFSSHSVDISYPILYKLGIAKEEPVSVTIGATAITDIASLILFAICLPIHMTGFAFGPFMLQVFYIAAFVPVLIYGFSWLGKTVFKRLKEDPAEQMIFLLMVVGLSAGMAELVNVDPIVGSFLAGLAVSRTLPDVGVRHQIDVLGNSLFIPAFFVSLGILIDPAIIFRTLREDFVLVIAILLTVIIAKLLAGWLAGNRFNYSMNAKALMGALMTPQVSSTLAVALVAYESVNQEGVRLINESVLNSILVLMSVSAIVGTVAVGFIGKRLKGEEKINSAL